MRHVDAPMTHVNDFNTGIGEMMAPVCAAEQAKSWTVQWQHVHMIADATVGRHRQAVPQQGGLNP
ncbi:MAG: hypothetical protein ACREPL_08545 [Rhodanobacteraceae bacterium]